MRRLPVKARFGQTADAKSGNGKKAAGKKLRLDLRCEQVMNRWVLDTRHRSDVEDIQIVPAKHHARNILDRHADTAIDRSVRCLLRALVAGWGSGSNCKHNARRPGG